MRSIPKIGHVKSILSISTYRIIKQHTFNHIMMKCKIRKHQNSRLGILMNDLGLGLKQLFIVVAIAFFAPISCSQPVQNKAPLNILLITADDLGLQLGCYGDTVAHTPHLDSFARQGAIFKNAYVTQASCSPSRSSMLTGLYPHQNGQIGLAHRGYWMFDRIRTLPQMLKAEGYVNAIIGKLNVEPVANLPFDYANTDARKTRDVADVASQAKTFMDTVNHPFFLMVNYFDPHVELIPQVKGIPNTPDKAGEVNAFPFQQLNTPAELSRIANYYSCVERLDAGFGMLMDALTKSGKAANTLVIFLGDHGPPFLRAKTSCYEAGLKVPFLVKWPDRPALEFSSFINANDILPTVIDAAQATIPTYRPGSSLKPIFYDQPFKDRQYVFGEFTAHVPQLFYPMRSVRDKRYKLIVNYLAERPFPFFTIDGDPAWQESRQEKFAGTQVREVFDRYIHRPPLELYDLTEDPWEFNNLAGDPSRKAVISRLQEALVKWQQETHDPLLTKTAFARMVQVHQDIMEESRKNPDYKPEVPILWTDYKSTNIKLNNNP